MQLAKIAQQKNILVLMLFIKQKGKSTKKNSIGDNFRIDIVLFKFFIMSETKILNIIIKICATFMTDAIRLICAGEIPISEKKV